MILLFYRLVEFLVKLGLPMYFSDIVVVGKQNIPKTGPMVIIGNHPNMMLDGLVIATTVGRPVSIWAKGPLFKGFPGKILRALGCIPVQRRLDLTAEDAKKHGTNHLDNSVLQKETWDAFKTGRALLLFPEGTSHNETHILHLKDGLAWMLFDFYDSTNGNIDVPILPCGITYTNKDRFRSQVELQYATTVRITKEQLEEYRLDKKSAVKKLTSQIEQILYNITINTSDFKTLRLVHAARRIYMDNTPLSLVDYVEVTRRFATVYEKHREEPFVKKLTFDLEKYLEGLEELHLNDHQVRTRDFTFISASVKLFERLFFLIVLLPLALSGFILNAPIMIVGKLTNVITPYPEATATLKLGIPALLVPGVYFCYAAFLAWYFSWNFFIVLITLSLFGMAHVRILEEEALALRSAKSTINLLLVLLRNSRKQELARLRDMRTNLEIRITKCVEMYASPEEKILTSVDGMHLGKRIMPKLMRSGSLSDVYL